jgi:PAS domain S-box-containing protein
MIALLYVDDEPELLDLCKRFLEIDGEFSVFTASSANQGLETLSGGRFDAIISDYQMPGMDGIEFLKQVRSQKGDIPFILFTGRGREEVVIEAINQGADFYLQKGGDPRAMFSELGHKIRQAVRRRKVEGELQLLKHSVSNAAEGILWIDREGGITYFNDTLCVMLGYTRDECSRLTIMDINPEHSREQFASLLQNLLVKKSMIVREIHRKKDGTLFPVELHVNYLEFGNEPYIFSFVVDITDRMRAEEDLKNSHEALQLANRKLNLLAEITRHDIRNKLTVLSGYLSLFDEHPAEPHYSMYLQKLKDTVSAIGANIEFTRLYQNLGVTVPSWQNVHEVFFHACTQLDIKKIRIQSDTGGLEIFADPLLERVFYNIIENAVEHGARLSHIRLLACETGDGMVITIEDDGVGIPNHEKEKIFQKGHGKNTGLGLFLSREILSITGISITESGEYQHGARFELKVPTGMYRYSGTGDPAKCFILKKN